MATGRVHMPANPPGVDITDADAVVAEVLDGKTFYAVSGGKKTGTMTDRGTVNTDITTKAQEVSIAAGKHSGSGVVKISAAEQAKIIAENIKDGITILGQAGSHAGGGGGSIIVREYTAGATWTKPAGLLYAWVVCVGAGGGAGGGGRHTDTELTGGGGGGGGGLTRRFLIEGDLPSSVSVSVGAGGNGGSGRGTNGSGNAGGDGGATSFGSLVAAGGGRGGGGGSTGHTIGGAAGWLTQSVPVRAAWFEITCNGGNSQINHLSGGNAPHVNNSNQQTPQNGGLIGGGGGGGQVRVDLGRNGGNGSSILSDHNGNSSGVLSGGIAPGGHGSDGGSNIALYLLQEFGANPIISKGVGVSGSGGAGNEDGNGGNGGNGGDYGSGGGGGGASWSGISGSGGAGGGGLCIVVEFY